MNMLIVYHMKAGISMNDDRINELMKNIKSNPSPSSDSVNDFIQKNLTKSQADAVQNVLKNPQLIKDILATPQAKQLFERLGGKREE